jgi:predicted acylesterase/phospholipase RssA
LNKFETIELSHKTNPDLGLLQALTMSSSLPGIFMPTIIDDCCYIDGGVMCNYPINQCLRDHANQDELLGLQLVYNNENEKYANVSVNNESSLLEYVICMSINSMNYIRDSVKLENITNTIKCRIDKNPLTLDSIQETIRSQELRKKWIELGETDATEFLHTLSVKM